MTTAEAISICNSETCIHGQCQKLPDQDEHVCECDRGWDGETCSQKLPLNEVFPRKDKSSKEGQEDPETPSSTNKAAEKSLLSKDKIRLYVSVSLAVTMVIALAVSTYMLWEKSRKSYRPAYDPEPRPSKGKIVLQSTSLAHLETV